MEGILLVSGLSVAGITIRSGESSLAYLLFPFLVVAAIRLGQAGAVLASMVVAAVAVPMTASGRGPFSVGRRDRAGGGRADDERRRARDELEGMVREGVARLTEREVQLAQARELERAKDEAVAVVSHDLRTPLTSIRGFTELLTDDEAVGERARPYVEVIDRNSGKLLDLVDDLLIVA